MENIQEFINNIEQHNINNVHPPTDPKLRHEWECKQLYSVIECLTPDCSVLDYGCGAIGTLQYTLFNYCKDANYYGLDVPDRLINPPQENVYLGSITELNEILPKVDCMVMGSIFTHLDWEGVTNVLDQTLPYYERGFQVGFTAFLGNKYELYGSDHYGPNTYHISIIPKEKYQEYCDKNNLTLIVHDYIQNSNHTLPPQQIKYQSFITIKKK